MEEKKRGQHYVWRYYLTSWADDSGTLFCLRDNHIFPTNPKNIAKARDFYRLRELSQHEIAIIEQVFIKDYWSKPIQQLNKNWVKMFTSVFTAREHLKSTGALDDKKEAQLDVVINNLVEDFHSRIEDENLPHLDSLKNGNVDFLSGKIEKHEFMFFLCLQYFRTNMIRNNVLRSFASGSRSISPSLIQNVWSVLYFILATNLAYSLSSDDSYRALILKNTSPLPFITGDQPVINTRTDYSNYEQATDLELYYPISPSLALLITDSNHGGDSHQTTVQIQENEVAQYNKLIFDVSDEQIYANNVNALNMFIKHTL